MAATRGVAGWQAGQSCGGSGCPHMGQGWHSDGWRTLSEAAAGKKQSMSAIVAVGTIAVWDGLPVREEAAAVPSGRERGGVAAGVSMGKKGAQFPLHAVLKETTARQKTPTPAGMF